MAETTQGSTQTSSANTGAANTASSAEASTATSGAQYATKAELADFQKAIQETLQAQSGVLGGIQNSLKGLKKPAAETKTEDSTLTERIAAIEKREAAQRASMKTGSLKSAAMAKGVPERRAEQFARYVLAEHDGSISVTDDYRTVFRESDEKTVSITDWVNAYLQTTDGEMFLPPKAAGSSDGQTGAGKTAATTHEYDSMSFEQIMEDRKKHPARYDAYTREHADKWAAKQPKWK